MKLLISLFFILIISSCGKSSDSNDTQGMTNFVEKEEAMKEGEYVAFLRTINSSVNGYIPFGRAELSLKEDEFKVVTYLDDDQRVMHIQRIHTGRKCPTLEDDLNGDGYIDIIEAEKALGSVLIPLDNDLSSREAGEDKYPIGSSFTYTRSAKWSTILEDLKKDYKEGYYVLEGDVLNLEDRVILIHGTSYSSLIPDTLQTHEGIEPHLSVPVVCGVIKSI